MLRHAWLTYLSMASLLGLLYVVHFSKFPRIKSDPGGFVILILTTIFFIYFGIILFRQMFLRKAADAISKGAEEYYLHGFKLSRYVDNLAFWRLQKWLGSGMCYELSILAMIMLRYNKTAVLLRGYSYNKNNDFATRHSWVEFKVPLNGWYVIDFSWINEGIAFKKEFFETITADGAIIDIKWKCTYKEFWRTPLACDISAAMKNQRTSHVLGKLSAFGNPEADGYGFTELCYSKAIFRYFDGSYMIPYLRSNGKPLSNRIIRDFVKNPKRKQPKAKSIRLAHAGIKEVGKAISKIQSKN